MDITQIMATIQHRYPMLLVDRILEMEAGVRAVGVKNVTANEEIMGLQCAPVFPNVLIVEHAAQIGCMLVLASPENTGKLGLFAGIEEVEFRQPVVPGDQLVTEITVLRLSSRAGKIHFVSRVDGVPVADGRYTFLLVPDPAAPKACAGTENA